MTPSADWAPGRLEATRRREARAAQLNAAIDKWYRDRPWARQKGA